ncbi:MAG TPA: hypothetical protein VGK38_01585 [Prolixibacteraceae bacterium]|jgi:hypothetical protein
MRIFTFKKVAPREQPFTPSKNVENRMSASASNAFSKPADSKTAETDHDPYDTLNGLIAVHFRAVAALKKNGWRNKGDLWVHPGNEIIEDCHAKYSMDLRAGCYKFINCSTNGHPFQVKGYTDVRVICELEFDGRMDECIQALALVYLGSSKI